MGTLPGVVEKTLRTGALARIRRAAASARRSTLYRWMLAHHDEFAAAVAEAGRPNWQALAQAFAAEGLTDLRGNPPSAEGARQTWFKVRKAAAARAGPSRAPIPQAMVREAPREPLAGLPADPPPASAAAPIASLSRSRPRVALRPARASHVSEPPGPDGSQLPRPVPRNHDTETEE